MAITDWLDDFCGDTFWNATWMRTSSVPYVSPCFQHTLLVWAPALFLLVCSPLAVLSALRSRALPLQWTTTLACKLFLSVLLAVDSSVMLIRGITLALQGGSAYELVYGLVMLVSSCVTFALTMLSQRRGVVSSGTLFLTWTAFAIFGLPEFYWWILQVTNKSDLPEGSFDTVHYVCSMVYYVLIWLQLILSCFAEKREKAAGEAVDPMECPELKASFINRLLFYWFTPMCIKGYKKALEFGDLWSLNERDSSKVLVPNWEKRWLGAWREYSKKLDTAKQSAPVGSGASEKTPLLEGADTDKEQKGKSDGAYTYSRLFKKPAKTAKLQPPSMVWRVFMVNKRLLIEASLIKIVCDLLQFVNPQLLNLILGFIQDPAAPFWQGLFYAAVMFLVAMIRTLMLHQYFQRVFTAGLNTKTILTSAVLTKSLRLSSAARREKTIGEIVNLMAVDIQRFQDITNYGLMFISLPFQLILCVVFLWGMLGYSVLAGVLVMLLTVPVNMLISMRMQKFQVAQMKHKDERLKLMNEILNGMKVLKLYAWEPSMEKLVSEVRAKEVRLIRNFYYYNICGGALFFTTPFLVAIASFGTYVLTDPLNHQLTPQVAFVSLSLFNILRFPLNVMTDLIAYTVQVVVSNRRIKGFLVAPELDPTTVERLPVSDERAVSVRKATFSWDRAEGRPVLRDIDLEATRGQLVAVVGQVGAGKSSLLSAILGEMDRVGGTVGRRGTVAYVPQQSWIQNLPLMSNITFGQPFDKSKYERVVDGCALRADFDILPAGDTTEIGEKGINLSGGQKARVSLARAVYQESDVYLLDDPLSAVDSHVGKHIFDEVLGPAGMLHDKTRILVTHSLNCLQHVDNIIVLSDGKITETGTYEQLMRSKGAFADILEEYLLQEVEEQGLDATAEEAQEVLAELEKFQPERRATLQQQLSRLSGSEKSTSTAKSPRRSTRRTSSVAKSQRSGRRSSHAPVGREASKSGAVDAAAVQPTSGGDRLIEVEKSETGRVKFSVYLAFFSALGYMFLFFFLFFYLLSVVFQVGSNFWLAAWSDVSGKADQMPLGERLGVYGAIGCGQALSIMVAGLVWTTGIVRSSKLMHSRLVHNLMRSPMAFYDTTPLGRILNRVGKDVEVLDNRLPSTFRAWINCCVTVLSSLVVIVISTPLFGLVILPMGVIYFFILRFYISTSRQLKRLESVSRSPIYSHFQETVSGAASIRAYDVEQRFVLESERRVDRNNATMYPSFVSNRWVGVYLEFIGNVLVLFAALFAVMSSEGGAVTAGVAGLSVSYALQITGFLNFAVRTTSDLETNIVAVERIIEYSETPTEAEWRCTEDEDTPPAEWPDRGTVEFRGYGARYRPGLDLVLHSVDAAVKPREKIGIVGRTGAGKSSLTLALFRIIEPAHGQILIDNRDIAQMGLHDLRSKLTIIPQEPVLFSGNLRLNLDPFGDHSDMDLWQALQRAHLKEYVQSLPDRLDHAVSEGGDNLSVGQRQLLCLARALLRKSRILVLDEATAAVDMETDALVQKTIRQEFDDCTILTIAHRLNTILDNDRVFVLDAGRIVEMDSPQQLLDKKESVFYSMAKDAGLVGST